MKRAILAAAVLTMTTFATRNAAAQELTLRAGADFRPIIAFVPGGVVTFDELGWLGLHLAPGLEVAEVLTIELDIIPLIPLSGDAGFEFSVAPGVRLDLAVIYARGSLPIGFAENGVNIWVEGAVGISIMQYVYLGVTLDYSADYEAFMIGAEAGINIDLMEL